MVKEEASLRGFPRAGIRKLFASTEEVSRVANRLTSGMALLFQRGRTCTPHAMPAKPDNSSAPKKKAPEPATRKPSTYDIVTVSKVGPLSSDQVQRAAKLGKTITMQQLRTKLGWK